MHLLSFYRISLLNNWTNLNDWIRLWSIIAAWFSIKKMPCLEVSSDLLQSIEKNNISQQLMCSSTQCDVVVMQFIQKPSSFLSLLPLVNHSFVICHLLLYALCVYFRRFFRFPIPTCTNIFVVHKKTIVDFDWRTLTLLFLRYSYPNWELYTRMT